MTRPVRYKLKSPTPEIHQQALKLVPEYGRVLVDNSKRLSLSAEINDPESISALRKLGVDVERDSSFDMDHR